MMPNDTDSVEFELSNIGSGVINYSIYTDSHNSWLSLSTDGGVLASGETEFITAFFNSANLDVGEYTCNIVISDDRRNVTFIPVTLTIEPTSVEENQIPKYTSLLGNFPNPFKPLTSIAFALSKDGKVDLEIYNVKGQKVRTLFNESLKAGYHDILWDGKDDKNQKVSSGIYFYKLKTNHFVDTKKMILMK